MSEDVFIDMLEDDEQPENYDTELKERYSQEPWGKLLLEMGMEPYDTESSARRVAEHAAERIAKLGAEKAQLMNDPKMNIAGTMRIGEETEKSWATISNTGEIEITGTEDEIRQCIENTPQHLKFAGHLVLEVMRLRRALDAASCSRLPATPETDAMRAEYHAAPTWWIPHRALRLAEKLERERDAITTNASREIADLRDTLWQIIAHDCPGFPHGTCARIAEAALGPENQCRSLPPNPQPL